MKKKEKCIVILFTILLFIITIISIYNYKNLSSKKCSKLKDSCKCDKISKIEEIGVGLEISSIYFGSGESGQDLGINAETKRFTNLRVGDIIDGELKVNEFANKDKLVLKIKNITDTSIEIEYYMLQEWITKSINYNEKLEYATGYDVILDNLNQSIKLIFSNTNVNKTKIIPSNEYNITVKQRKVFDLIKEEELSKTYKKDINSYSELKTVTSNEEMLKQYEKFDFIKKKLVLIYKSGSGCDLFDLNNIKSLSKTEDNVLKIQFDNENKKTCSAYFEGFIIIEISSDFTNSSF